MLRLCCTLGLLFGSALTMHAQEPLQRIAFGSCAKQDKPQPIWDAVVETKPQLFLFIGDNIYGDPQTASFSVIGKKARKLRNPVSVNSSAITPPVQSVPIAMPATN